MEPPRSRGILAGGQIPEAFQARFAIPRILEFYAATEGNFSLYNVEGKPGAIGRIPSFLARRFPAAARARRSRRKFTPLFSTVT